MNKKKGTSLFENGLIWFGAGVSIAEILTGTYFSSLGFWNGLFAIIVGHIIGIFLLFLAGYIGAVSKKSAMETTKMSFGSRGGLFFAALNVLQLVGWTSIMIYDGSLSAKAIIHTSPWVLCFLIGGLIIIWLAVGITNLGKINTVTMSALLLLTLVLCKILFFKSGIPIESNNDTLSFGSAVELAVAMPLSWLPLISDYTREAERPFAATFTSALTY